MKWIGITGPMGSGKSTVAAALREKGFPVIDADRVVGEILESDPGARGEILKTFGDHLARADGTLDRRALAAEVFGRPERLTALEAILHPRVRARVEDRRAALARDGHELAFYDVPLLFERHMESLFDFIVVVSASPALRLTRAMARTGLTAAEIELRWAAQLPPEYKEARASAIVRNDGDAEQLHRAVTDLVERVRREFAGDRGYSLVELMVSVAIVGILAALAGPSYEGLVDKAKYGRAKGDMGGIRSAAMGLRAAEDANLPVAMNQSCTCNVQGFQVGTTPVCSAPDNALGQWQKLGYDAPPMDPWGQCYLLDENEGEFGASDCRFDAIASGGKDQKFAGWGDGDDVAMDDAMMRVPYFSSHPNCTGSIDAQFGGN